MPRPRKCRKVCCLPERVRFGPLESSDCPDKTVLMSVEEYETVRLIDLEGLTQEECAGRMSIARTTVQGIYNEARRKLADSLVNGSTLRIEGGDYRLCDGNSFGCGGNGCRRRRCLNPCPEAPNTDGERKHGSGGDST